jgi:hypothetical protein
LYQGCDTMGSTYSERGPNVYFIELSARPDDESGDYFPCLLNRSSLGFPGGTGGV